MRRFLRAVLAAVIVISLRTEAAIQSCYQVQPRTRNNTKSIGIGIRIAQRKPQPSAAFSFSMILDNFFLR